MDEMDVESERPKVAVVEVEAEAVLNVNASAWYVEKAVCSGHETLRMK